MLQPFEKDGNVFVWVRIEIKKGSVVKYEWSEELNALIVDRILHGSQHYFFNYGEVPCTLAGDGDCLDAIVLTDPKLSNGSFILCKVIGLLATVDEKGEDAKLIVVPADKVDPESVYRRELDSVSEASQRKIRDFYETYKSYEDGKWVRIEGFKDRTFAEAHVLEAKERFEREISSEHKRVAARLDEIERQIQTLQKKIEDVVYSMKYGPVL